jgi:hypothetical protein
MTLQHALDAIRLLDHFHQFTIAQNEDRAHGAILGAYAPRRRERVPSWLRLGVSTSALLDSPHARASARHVTRRLPWTNCISLRRPSTH